MTSPIRIQLSRKKGWKMPENTVKVDRSTRWGNPFRVGEPVDMLCARRWGWVLGQPTFVAQDALSSVRRFSAALVSDEATHDLVKEHLRGKNLACWCRPDQPCHADVLLEFANAPTDEAAR
ncbi:DUF4326 domain-containing protein [Aminobacter sp. P9b]|uniref:DUF4326 domain-containing protein n=1 Tax=Aminobacter sp. P9b TaxID=3133697 RepID=UPI00324A3800